MSSSPTHDEIPPEKEHPAKNASESAAKKSLFQETHIRSTSQTLAPPPPPGLTPSDVQQQAPNNLSPSGLPTLLGQGMQHMFGYMPYYCPTPLNFHGPSSSANPQHLTFPPPAGGQDGNTELVKALMAQIQLDHQEAKERERRDEARMVALERALLQAHANNQPSNNGDVRRVERRVSLGDSSRDPPLSMEDPTLPSNSEYYEGDDPSYHSSQDPTYFPPDTPTHDRVYEIDGAPTNSSQVERALHRSTRDQVTQNQTPVAQTPTPVERQP
ncbi:hypothetical protein COLO4_09303 [Corchorus olitorius]|uniref:Uncharacterized protein n=1 Tax=Corchorus olitorius TaxID=93759 RepID=A0A1R3KCH5_9ROSI|nr:hypothetical protein COLO4_09303 [Corchorus olitorius]